LGIRQITTTTTTSAFDVAIIGGGIVGVATARELLIGNPALKVCLMERESTLGKQQSSHNSGVIHSGVYYKPGSARARLCVQGSRLMYDYLQQNNIAHERCGKLIVAVNDDELSRLDDIYQRGLTNGVPDLRMVDPAQMKEIEPHVVGLRAIHSPHTGIVDFGVVTQSFGSDVKRMGGNIMLNFNASQFDMQRDGTMLVGAADGRQVSAAFVISCAGMYSDRVAKLAYGKDQPHIVPFRGHFLRLKDEHRHLIKGNVYPVPNPQFPFLGVHFTKRINGEVWLGPNAVFATSREGYHYSDVNLRDMYEAIINPGFRRLAAKHIRTGVQEFVQDVFPRAFLQRLLPYMPQLTVDQVESAGSGVRAQALSMDGTLIEDFIFDAPDNKPILHVRNSPSPSATSSLAIAQEIVKMAKTKTTLPLGIV
ncbi:hypothetical protein SAMD00019534_021000, partial [Acytostelium subglobosum LB1]|uniref:hypothetical protein n=1 Tax=Acytostelium subglobosum LB1 TaxID=1410327 RepID=UPI000645004E